MVKSQTTQLETHRVELQEPNRVFGRTFYIKEEVDKLLEEKDNKILELQAENARLKNITEV